MFEPDGVHKDFPLILIFRVSLEVLIQPQCSIAVLSGLDTLEVAEKKMLRFSLGRTGWKM